MTRLIALATLLLISNAIFAQAIEKSNVTGTVISTADKKAIADVNVTLQRKHTGKTIAAGVTDATGSFRLQLADTGVFAIVLSHTGFKTKTLLFTAGNDFKGWEFGKVALEPGEGILPDVVVKTDKPLVEQKADRLVYNAERDLGSLGGTAADVLRNVPMLSVDGDGNVQLRGSSNIRVLINNRPSSIIAVNVADALKQLPADMIKTVEVITSPSAKYDAEGTAGIINIITKKILLQGVTGSVNIVPGNVSTIGNAGLNFRRRKYGLSFSAQINQFYNTGTSFLERRNFADNSIFRQEGKTRNRSGFVSPRIGFDYSFNDRNSISGGFAYNPSHDRVKNAQVVTNIHPTAGTTVNNLDLFNETKDAGYDFNMDYLRTFKDPQREFSILTMHSISNSDNIANQDAYNSSKTLFYQQRNLNKSRNTETTIQADYSHPLKNKTLIELGAKTILRTAGSDVAYKDIYPTAGTEVNAANVFSYHQDVIAGYLLYGFKLFKKLNLKLGGRYERTLIDADYKTKNFAFETEYDNWIPSVNASYSINPKHTFRAGYTKRLQRPQLFFLNPYREVISPQVIRQGNPLLDAEVADLVELGYGTYGKTTSFNVNMFARITNNAITSNLALKNDTTYISFLNIAKNKTYGISLSSNTKPFKWWSINANLNVYYVTLEDGAGTGNEGWMFNAFTGSNINLGNGWWHGFNGSFTSRRVSLQGRVAAFYYHNTTIRKDIWNKRGSIGINLANPFMRGTRFRSDIATAIFEQREDNTNYTRGIRLSFTYRFGKLEQNKAPRKASKRISNDDALRGQ